MVASFRLKHFRNRAHDEVTITKCLDIFVKLLYYAEAASMDSQRKRSAKACFG